MEMNGLSSRLPKALADDMMGNRQFCWVFVWRLALTSQLSCFDKGAIQQNAWSGLAGD